MSPDAANPKQSVTGNCSGAAVAFHGGSFDPVHLGHLIMAQDAFEQFDLERVYFIPAAQNPLKANAPGASFVDRVNMLRRAVAGDKRFDVLELEQQLPSPSYTLQTVEALRVLMPGKRFYWIIGSDQLRDLHRWHRIGVLVQLVEFICVARPCDPMELPPIDGLRVHSLKAHQVDISSTEIRRRIHGGMPVDFYLHHGVFTYINELRLYTS
ncbi:MAG: nicotinate (nicotinamide) nucleotide adenylyltransferase [Verrucomicrobiota bacterium]|nr:nicotinate (nicotinamide) nucleotide adenylyltransferase [Verrucomicrobiota bacterium]